MENYGGKTVYPLFLPCEKPVFVFFGLFSDLGPAFHQNFPPFSIFQWKIGPLTSILLAFLAQHPVRGKGTLQGTFGTENGYQHGKHLHKTNAAAHNSYGICTLAHHAQHD